MVYTSLRRTGSEMCTENITAETLYWVAHNMKKE
jgi:hypothetical protein